MHELVEAKPEHLAEVASRMAQADRDEVWALAQHTPLEALQHAAALSSGQTYAGLVNGRAECIFGLAETPFGASPWLLTTEDLTKVAKVTFVRESKRVVDIWKDYNDLLVNYVDERHTEAVKWLRWLGFSIYAPIPLGSGQFHRAEWKKHV